MNEKLQLKNKLKEYRNHYGLSQDELARLVGVSRNTISSIEREEYYPSTKLAYILYIALDVKFEELFYLVEIQN